LEEPRNIASPILSSREFEGNARMKNSKEFLWKKIAFILAPEKIDFLIIRTQESNKIEKKK